MLEENDPKMTKNHCQARREAMMTAARSIHHEVTAVKDAAF